MSAAARMAWPDKAAILTATLATMFCAMSFGYTAPILAINLETMTGSGTIIGILVAVAAITTVGAFAAPGLMRRFGGRKIVALSLSFSMVTMPIYPLIVDVPLWLALRFLQGVGITFCFVICESWINQRVIEEKRGFVLGIYATVLAGGLGVGALLSSLTLFVFAPSDVEPFLIGSALLALGLIPFAFQRLVPGPDAPDEEESSVKATLRYFLIAPSILIAAFMLGTVEIGIYHFLPVYGVRLGFAESIGTSLVIAAALGTLCMQIPIGMIADKVDRQKLMLVLALATIIGPALMLWAGAAYVALLATTFFYMGLTTALYMVGLIRLGERFKGKAIVPANAAFVMAFGLGSLSTPMIAGKMMDIYDPHGLLWTWMGIAVICTGFMYFRYFFAGKRH